VRKNLSTGMKTRREFRLEGALGEEIGVGALGREIRVVTAGPIDAE